MPYQFYLCIFAVCPSREAEARTWGRKAGVLVIPDLLLPMSFSPSPSHWQQSCVALFFRSSDCDNLSDMQSTKTASTCRPCSHCNPWWQTRSVSSHLGSLVGDAVWLLCVSFSCVCTPQTGAARQQCHIVSFSEKQPESGG